MIELKRSVSRARPRPGFSLIEVLVVITISSALVAAAVGLIHTMIRLQRGDEERIRAESAMEGLAEWFRDDVHAATALRPIAAPPGQASRPAWELLLTPSRKVEYRAEDGRLLRLEQEGNKLVHREAFRLPRPAVVSIEAVDPGSPKLVRLRIAVPAAVAAESPWRPVQIDAVLALDHRFTSPEGL
jgi:prepilin-type N-terminal cleavage/methylation domain-containing protein